MRYIVLMLGLWLLAAAPSSHAAVPMVKTQAPGFYRMMLGDFEVTAADRRKQVFSDVAARRYFVGGAHLAFPGLGHLRANRPDSYVSVPVTYSVPH